MGQGGGSVGRRASCTSLVACIWIPGTSVKSWIQWCMSIHRTLTERQSIAQKLVASHT